MNSNLVRKTVCLLVILAMVLTTFAVIPLGTAKGKGGKSRYRVTGTVYYKDPNFAEVQGITVILYNLHTGEQQNNVTDEDGAYLFKNVVPGHYQVFAKPEVKDYLTTDESKYLIEVPNPKSDKGDVSKNLRLDYIPPVPKSIFQGYVVDNEANPIESASIILKSIAHPKYKIISEMTNETGEFIIETFRGPYELWATADGFQYNITTINLDKLEVSNFTIMLANRTESIISGIMGYEEGDEPDVDKLSKDLFLFDLDNNETLYRDFTGTVFNIKAYHGNFSLIIDAAGYAPYYHPAVIQLGPNTKNSFEFDSSNIPKLKKTKDEKITTTVTFPDNDWNNVKLSRIWTLNHDSEIFGLEYVNYQNLSPPITIGCPRFQVDMEPGFGGVKDGIVGGEVENDPENKDFKTWLKDRGPYYMYTNGVFEIKDNHFGWDKSSFSASPSGFTGTYDNSKDMKITTNCNYKPILDEGETLDDESFDIKFFNEPKNKREHEVIIFKLPSGYEISEPQSFDDNDNVWVKDYNECQINGTATIIAVKLEDPTAIIHTTEDYVDVLQNITFNGSFSKPGSGMIANYTWDLKDGPKLYGEEVTHNYTTPGVRLIELTVRTSSNLVHSNTTNITVDNTKPTALFEFQNDTFAPLPVGPNGHPIADESYKVPFNITFNATKSKDTIDGTELGEIDRYNWDFGNGKVSDGEVAKSTYEQPGIYNVTLNVTDAANHYSVLMRQLEIRDIEPPEPKLITIPTGRTLEIDKWIELNATQSTDNSLLAAGWEEIRNTLKFKWDLDLSKDSNNDGIFENDEDATGAIINFSVANFGNKVTIKPGPHPICLWVTDSTDNTANTTDLAGPEWTIDIIGVDLRFAPIDETSDKFISKSKSKPKEGEKVKFTINITNDGQVTAWDVQVKMYVDGKEKGKKTIDKLEEADFKKVRFSWKAEGVKEHNISFNVSYKENDNLTYEEFWDNNYKELDLEVTEKTLIDTPCLVAIVIIVIVVIILIIYFYRRRREEYGDLGRRRNKGKGKGKKEKKEPEKKDKDKKKKGKGKGKGKKKKD